MEKEKLGTEKIEKVLSGVLKVAVTAKKVLADSQVNAADLAHVVGLVAEISELVAAVKAAPEAFEEIKDIDLVEVVAMIQKVDGLVKEFEKA